MKKAKQILVALVSVTSIAISSLAQVSTAFNTGLTTNYVGWNSLQLFPLRIEHQGNQPINFSTNGTQKATITSIGNLGLGLVTPVARLHLTRNGINGIPGSLFRADGLNTEVNTWQLFTGFPISSVTEKFRLYSEISATPWIGFQSLTNGFRIETGGALQRMRINGTSSATINGSLINTSGFVGITPTASTWLPVGPQSALHLMEDALPQTAGFRPWMRIGVTCTASTDLMYTGLRVISPNITEAVIAFGDDAEIIPSTGPDQMVVRCVSGGGSDASGVGGPEGLEIMRFKGSGIGGVGVGDEFSHTSNDLQPQRRMHIHDPGADNVTNAQLRISNVLSVSSPVATDFRVTPAGNLYINNYGSDQRVGIEEPSPQERLDVAGNGRFQNIPNTTANCVLLGETVTTGQPQDNRLKRLDFNSDPDTYLAGDGTWQPATGVCDWNIVNNGGINDLATGYTGACVERNVGVGISSPFGKLDVVRGQTSPLIADPIALKVSSSDNPLNNNSGIPIPGLFIVGDNTFATYSTVNAVSTTDQSFAGYFKASGARSNIGLYTTYCSTIPSVASYGIYAYSPPPTGPCGSVGFAGFFNGNVNVQGVLTINGAQVMASDASIKTNVTFMEGATEKLLALNPVTYNLTNETCTNVTYEADLQCGLIAQEVAEVFPDMVEDLVIPNAMEGSDESLTIKGIQYTELIPVLIKGFQEQNKRIQNLEEQLAACCTSGMRMQNDGDGSETINTKNITLSDKNSIVLNQNVPNPFAERTTISYNLPENVLKAQLMFYDNKGTLINTQEIETRGVGIFNVFANDLSSGSYSYALVVDGKIIDTKTMVKTK
jgi:hypothetical protein